MKTPSLIKWVLAAGLTASVGSLRAQTAPDGGVPVRIWASGVSSSYAGTLYTAVSEGYMGSSTFYPWVMYSWPLGYFYAAFDRFGPASFYAYGQYYNITSPYIYWWRQQTQEPTCARIAISGNFLDGPANSEASTPYPNASLTAAFSNSVRVSAGKSYTINLNPYLLTSGTVCVTAPPQYRVILNGIERNRCDIAGAVTVVVVPSYEGPPGAAGFASSFTPDRLDWRLPLGTLRNGDDAGSLRLIDAGVRPDWYCLFSPAALSCEPASDEVYVYRENNIIRQVIANQVAIDIVPLTSPANSYEIRCYNPQQIQASGPPATFSGEPFAKYRVQPSTDEGDPATTIKISREFREQVGGGFPVVRTEETKLVRTGSLPNFSWKKHDWHTGTDVLQETTAAITVNGARRTEVLRLQKPGAVPEVALAGVRVYDQLGFGEALTSESIGTANTRTTQFSYYSAVSQPGSLGYVESVRVPGGGWEAYEYFDSNLALSYQGGRLKTRFRPFGTNAGDTPTKDPNQGEVTSFEYGPDPFGFNSRLTSIVTKVGGVTTSRSIISYSSAALNAMITRTRQDFAAEGIPVTTVTEYYSEGWSDKFFRGKPRFVRRPDGTTQEFTYERGTWNGTTFNPAAPPIAASRISVETYPTTGAKMTGRSTKEVAIRDARALVVRTEFQVWNESAWEAVSWVNFTYNNSGLLTGRSASNGAAYTATWEGNFKTAGTDESGVRSEFTPDGAGRVALSTRKGATFETTNLADLVTSFAYDAASRTLQQRLGPATSDSLLNTKSYDDAGRMLYETSPGVGTTTHTYNVAMRTHKVTRPDPEQSTVIETHNLDGSLASRTGTGVVAEYYTHSVTAGGQRVARTDVATPTSARWSETTSDWLGRKVSTVRRGFGALPNLEETNVYDPSPYSNTGRLIKITAPGVQPTLFTFNAMSQLTGSGLDLDGNNVLLADSTDRVNGIEEFHEKVGSDWWQTKIENKYPNTAPNAGTPVQFAKTRKRLNGFGPPVAGEELREEIRSWDSYGNETTRTTRVNPTQKTTKIVTARGSVPLTHEQTMLNGLLLREKSWEGITLNWVYDSLGRTREVKDPRLGTTTTAYKTGTALIEKVTDPAGIVVAETAYDNAGRPVRVLDGQGYSKRTSYTARGEIKQIWGSGTYPVAYEYNFFGERIKMTTYRDPSDAAVPDTSSFPNLGAGDETGWEYDSGSGSLKRKFDAKGRFVEYDYNSVGRLFQRRWARNKPGSSTERLNATYTYNSATGELTGVSYNDDTPAVSYEYNRLGQNKQVTQASGAGSVQTLVDFKLNGTVGTEYLDGTFYGGRNLAWQFDQATVGFLGRVSGYAVTVGAQSEQAVSYSYETATGRLVSVATQAAGQSAFTHSFWYDYVANSNLLEKLRVDANHPFAIERGYPVLNDDTEKRKDLLSSIDAKWGTVSQSRYAYTYDERRQRRNVVQSGGAFADYGGSNNGAIHQTFAYNGRGELLQAATWLGDLSAGEAAGNYLSARNHQYEYDGIGNRRKSNTSGVTELADRYVVNELNQYTARENNTLAIGGTVADDAAIKVTATAKPLSAAGRHGRHWGDNILLHNYAGPFLGPLEIFAGKKDGVSPNVDRLRRVERQAFLAPAWQQVAYDEDGNVTSDGIWNYMWDAENRLVRMETIPETIGIVPASSARRLDFRYDHRGRRVEKLVRSRDTGGTYSVVELHRRYIYEGWNVIAELNVSSTGTLSVTRTYTWGLDIARSLTDAGGVGALLQIADHSLSKAYFPSYDGNGNVAALFAGDAGTAAASVCVAAYEYSPYGEFLRCEVSESLPSTERDALAAQPFRFSTKFTDNETGLVYYGRRYYCPSQGRFLGRDPIDERGGLNLFGFVGNNPVNRWDYLGMEDPVVLPPFFVRASRVYDDDVVMNLDGVGGGVAAYGGGASGGPFTYRSPVPVKPFDVVVDPMTGEELVVTNIIGIDANGVPTWDSVSIRDFRQGLRQAALAAATEAVNASFADLQISAGQIALVIAKGAGTAVVLTGILAATGGTAAPIIGLTIAGVGTVQVVGTYSDMRNNPGNYTQQQVLNLTAGNVGAIAGGVAIGGMITASRVSGPGDPNFIGPVAPWQIRPAGIPDGWVAAPAKRGNGVNYYDPANPGNSVRVMAGNPNNPFPNSQQPYVRWQQNGHPLDANGNVLPTAHSSDAHIPLSGFVFQWPPIP